MDRLRRLGRSVRERWRTEAGSLRSTLVVRWRVARLTWEASHLLSCAVVGFVVLEGALPPLALIAIGAATGHIPAAVRFGLGSPQGHALLWSLLVGAGAYAFSLMRGPLEDLIGSYASVRLSADLQYRLARAVSEPVGIEHLERPEVLDRLSAATGELSTSRPSDAPMTLAGALGDRLQGLLACIVIGNFRWWLGLMFLVGWVAMRPPLRRRLANRALLARRATPVLRHAWYYLGLTWRPEFAKEVRLFGAAPWALGRHEDAWKEGMAPSITEARQFERVTAVFAVGVGAMYALGAGVLGHAAYSGTASLRTVATVLPMFMMAMQVGGVNTDDVTLEQMLAAVPDVDLLIDELSARREPRGTAPVGDRPRQLVRFEDVSYTYPGAATPAVEHLDLELAAGHSLAIVGVNGAGKSTLVTLLARLRDPTAGRVTVDGTDLRALDPESWQRSVAVVYQDFTRYPLSARENVGLFDLGRGIDEEVLLDAARRAGAASFLEVLPDGYSTVLAPGYRRGTDLSGGQWQRVALARALYAVARGARVLVLDEPTAQLDIRSEAAFYDRFLELTAGVTAIVISHRFSTVRRAERIAVLDGGKVRELGSHDELLARGGVYAEMFKAQAAGFAPAGGTEASRDG